MGSVYRMLSVSVPAPHPSEWVSEECWNWMEEFQRGSDKRDGQTLGRREGKRERVYIYIPKRLVLTGTAGLLDNWTVAHWIFS